MREQLLALVEAAINKSKLDVLLDDGELGQAFIDTTNCGQIDYYPWMIEYHQQYLCFNDNQAQTFVLLLRSNNNVCGLLPLTVSNFLDKPSIGSNSSPLMPPFIDNQLSRKQQRKLYKKCLHFMTILANSLGIEQLTSQFMYFTGVSETWYNLLLENGGVPQHSMELFCNLKLGEEQLLAAIRDKYRSHIRRAEKLWRVEVKTQVSDDEFAQFEQLHLEVVGFRTRSELTWSILKQGLNDGKAFAVFAYDEADKLIGAALFTLTQTTAGYSVGVYDRELFDQPVSHIIHYKGIQKMRELGLTWYYLGARCHKHEWMNPTDKEWQIGHFKEGFATDSQFRVNMQLVTWPDN